MSHCSSAPPARRLCESPWSTRTRARTPPSVLRPRRAAWNRPGGCSIRIRRSALELVAQPADGDQIARVGGVRFDLCPEPLDVDVEGFGVADIVGAPHPVNQLAAGQHPACVAQQKLQELELLE